MISHLSGTILHTGKQSIILQTPGGIGYEINMSRLRVAELLVGKKLELFTYLKVSEQAMTLYGFQSMQEKSFFELLLSVKGVGPKSALNILSLGSINDIQSAIARGDAVYLSAVQGLGKKTAERLCVELKGKVTVLDVQTTSMSAEHASLWEDALAALVNMGYHKESVKKVLLAMDLEGKSIEAILKDALKALSIQS